MAQGYKRRQRKAGAQAIPDDWTAAPSEPHAPDGAFACTDPVCRARFRTEAGRDTHVGACLFARLQKSLAHAPSTPANMAGRKP